MRGAPHRRLRGLVALVTALVLGAGCATPARPTSHVDRTLRYFEAPIPEDPWTPQIASWQARERALPDVELLRPPAPVSNPPASATDRRPRNDAGQADLRAEYFAFRTERKRGMARELAAWIQATSKQHYIPDGPVDHWATTAETLARNGDDCDGLELLTYHTLRDLGFREEEVYRAIVFRPSDRQHHMVTLWFEDPSDPWVIDPTGAMTLGMPRMSDLPEWKPIKVFTDRLEYTVRPLARDLATNP